MRSRRVAGAAARSRPWRHIVERERELAELALAAREALSGEGSIMLIEAEAGIGKSSPRPLTRVDLGRRTHWADVHRKCNDLGMRRRGRGMAGVVSVVVMATAAGCLYDDPRRSGR